MSEFSPKNGLTFLNPIKGPQLAHKGITGVFKSKASASPPVPPPPTLEDTEGKAQDEGDRLRRRKGRASAILTEGNTAAPLTASKVLLGA